MGTDLTKAYAYYNFAKYEPGTKLQTVPGFGACQSGKIVDHGGNKVAETSIAKGDKGWSRWGFEYIMPRLVTGDEIWWRVGMFFPSDFNFATDHGSLKTFRFGRRTISDKKNKGCVDLQIRTDRDWRAIGEMNNWPGWVQMPGGKVERGKWQMFEAYVKFGNPGTIRMWRDGKMFAEITGKQTMQPGSELFRLMLFTYWNGSAPRSQSMKFDHMGIFIQGSGHSGKSHLDKDANGNRFIGTTLFDSVTPPPVDPEPEKVSWVGKPNPPVGQVGEPYHYPLSELIEGPRPLTLLESEGRLQEGLMLDSQRECITGTPIESGVEQGLRIGAFHDAGK